MVLRHRNEGGFIVSAIEIVGVPDVAVLIEHVEPVVRHSDRPRLEGDAFDASPSTHPAMAEG